MGIEIIRLQEDNLTNQAPPVLPEELAELTTKSYKIPEPLMHIWLMSLSPRKAVFPWWNYNPKIDDDINTLNNNWAVTSAQDFFDHLFLLQLYKMAGSSFYCIFPGNIKTENWGKLNETDRATFLRGQGCIYHLEGSFDGKLAINWVPFWEPQSMVRNPSFGSFWRIFARNKTDDVSNSISFFKLSNPRILPQVIKILIDKDPERSEKLTQLVDWFGLYSSPLKPNFAASSVIYSQHEKVIQELYECEKGFSRLYDKIKNDLLLEPVPKTVIRHLSRQLAI